MKILTFVLGTCFCVSAFRASAQNTYKGGDIVLSASRSFNPSVWRNDEMVFSKPVKIIIPAVVPIAQGNAGNHPVGAIIAFMNANNQKDSIVYKGIADVAKPSSPFNSSQMIKANKFVYNYGSSSLMPGDTVLVTYLKLVANMGDNSDPLQRLFVNVQLKPVEVNPVWTSGVTSNSLITDKTLITTQSIIANGGLKVGDSSIYFGSFNPTARANDGRSWSIDGTDNSNYLTATNAPFRINSNIIGIFDDKTGTKLSYKYPQSTILNAMVDATAVLIGTATKPATSNLKLYVVGGMSAIGGINIGTNAAYIKETPKGLELSAGLTNTGAIISRSRIDAPEFRACLNFNADGICPPDYVFEKGYKLKSIGELKEYIQTNKHLPEVPSANEMSEKGVNMTEMNMTLLKKVEELTLYIISLREEVDALKKEKRK